MSLPEPKPVVWFSIFDWWTSSHGHSDFELALALARSRPVLLVNSIGLRVPRPGRTERTGRRILRKLASLSRGLRRPKPELPRLGVVTLATPPIVSGPVGDVMRSLALQQLRWAMRRLGIRDPASVVTVPSALPLAEGISPGQIFYNRSDDHGAFPDASEAVRVLEARLLDEAAYVVYAARHLMRREAERTAGRALHLEHGVDEALFHPNVPSDPDLMCLPGPRLGFLGALRNHVVDFDLVAALADAMPEASVVLIGDRTDDTAALTGRPNLHLVPPRPHDETPACWAAMDVGLMPYRQTPWSRAIDPIKLREMLAMGLPIAATNIPAAQAWTGRIDIVEDPLRFPAAVQAALARGRQPAPQLPDWAAQAARLAALLDGGTAVQHLGKAR